MLGEKSYNTSPRPLIEYLYLTPILLWFTYWVFPPPFFQISDGVSLTLPKLGFAINELSLGRFPIWDEFNFCGASYLGHGATSPFNPSIILYFIFSPEWASSISTLLIYYLLVFGIWEYFRLQNLSIVSSLIGTLGYAMGGQIIFFSLYHGTNLVLMLYPWTLVAFHKYELTNRTRWLIISFFCMFFILAGGLIQLSFFALISVFFEGMKSWKLADIKEVFRFRALPVLLACVSASIVILPIFESILFSNRSFVKYPNNLFLPPSIQLLLLLAFGFSPKVGYPNYFFYIGLIQCSLLFYCLRRHFRSLITNPYITYAFIFPLIVPFLLHIFTGISSDPWRGMFIFIHASSLIVALGVERYLLKDCDGLKYKMPSLELIIALIISLFGMYTYYNFKSNITFVITPMLPLVITKALIFVILLILFCIILPTRIFGKQYRLKSIIISYLLVVGIIINALLSGQYLISNVNHADYLINIHKNGELLYSVVQEGRFAFKGVNDNFPLNWASYYKIRSIGGYSSVFPKSIFQRAALLDTLTRPPLYPYTVYDNCDNINTILLARYGVQYYVVDSRKEVGKLMAAGWKAVNFPNEIQKRSSLFIFSNPDYIGRAYVTDLDGNILHGSKIIENTSTYLKIITEGNAGEILILSDSWYPGWKCKDNGKTVEGYDEKGFRGYKFINSGYHEIEWFYQPISFYLGAILTTIGFISFFLFISIQHANRILTIDDSQGVSRTK